MGKALGCIDEDTVKLQWRPQHFGEVTKDNRSIDEKPV